jgi:hypothetical protein
MPSTDGTYSGVAWFDPELGRVMDVESSRDFKVTSNKHVTPKGFPGASGPMQSVTGHHHQAFVERLVSVE